MFQVEVGGISIASHYAGPFTTTIANPEIAKVERSGTDPHWYCIVGLKQGSTVVSLKTDDDRIYSYKVSVT